MDDCLPRQEGVDRKVNHASGGILTLDVGNTAVKLSLFTTDTLRPAWHSSATTTEEALEMITAAMPGVMIYGSSGRLDESLKREILRVTEAYGIRLIHLDATTPLPIGVCYMPRRSLGDDRVAAAAGAWTLTGGGAAMIADAGTALTLDLIGPGGFRGGRISPGAAMRFKALHAFTARLPMVAIDEATPFVGTTTAGCISSGVWQGMASEVIGAFIHEWSHGRARTLLLTGGDAARLLPLLEANAPAELIPLLRYEPKLVAIGLCSIARYNENLHCLRQ